MSAFPLRSSSFNPTLVRLRLKFFRTCAQTIDRFNPTLVRLRQFEKSLSGVRAVLFQSHAGSIEAHVPITEPRFRKSFQSHAGSIEAGSPERSGPAGMEFQSHAGSIEAPRSLPPMLG